MRISNRSTVVLGGLLLAALPMSAAAPVSATAPAERQLPAGWTEPFPAFRVIGPLYGVGTYDLSSFLITSDVGYILINTGMENSAELIRENIESLGFRLDDVKILLVQQSHIDHSAALAEIRALTGAEMWATAKDAHVLEDGGLSDPHFKGALPFEPIEVDHIITDGDVITLGDIELTVYEHPGHTEGSSSYSMLVSEGGKTYSVVIANMGTINDGKRLVVDPTYPGVADDFANTYRRQKAMDVDVWVAAHGSQYGLHDKWRPGQPYDPETFVDPAGFVAAVEKLEAIYNEQLAAERAEAAGDPH